MNTEPRLLIEKTWEDEHMIELLFRASRVRFAGEVEVYSTYDELSEVAADLANFPGEHPDHREFCFSAARGSNSVRLAFRTADRLGHCWLLATLIEREQSPEEATIALPFEPAALDSFLAQLRSLAAHGASIAILTSHAPAGTFPP